MKSELQEFIAQLINSAEKKKIRLINEKAIRYGVQLKFLEAGNEISLNVYYSNKKGISTVFSGKGSETKLRSILNSSPKKNFHNWNNWLGTDESGKGDFFGALVTCGFFVKKENVHQLLDLGIKDSKLISDQKILKIAPKIYFQFGKQLDVIILKPAKYNELYQKFSSQGKKLNELLAWMHARIILNLNKKFSLEGAIIDKFTHTQTLKNSLRELKNIHLKNRIKAESDVAVATASIIARYHFLKNLDELSEQYGMTFPKGASKKVVTTAKDFAKIFGKETLKEVAKIHFKTYQKI